MNEHDKHVPLTIPQLERRALNFRTFGEHDNASAIFNVDYSLTKILGRNRFKKIHNDLREERVDKVRTIVDVCLMVLAEQVSYEYNENSEQRQKRLDGLSITLETLYALLHMYTSD